MTFLRFFALALLLPVGYDGARAQSPSIDFSFTQPLLLAQARVKQAIQQPDGKRLVVGEFEKVQGNFAPRLARLLANGGQPDVVFNYNIQNLVGRVDHALLLASGKILLFSNSGDSLVLGRVRRCALLMLNGDGTPDAAFDTRRVIDFAYLDRWLAQPDGKVILAGRFSSPGGPLPERLIRLTTTGNLDPTFQPGIAGYGNVMALALQPDGKLLVGGRFTGVQGVAAPALARLTATGGLDASFNARASTTAVVAGLALQPDGNVLVALATGDLGGRAATVQRLRPTGAADPTFQLDQQVYADFPTITSFEQRTFVCLHPGGRVLVSGNLFVQGQGSTDLLRLDATGNLDATFAMPYTSALVSSAIDAMQPLANGQVLVSGTPIRYGRPTAARASVALLNTDGTPDAAFAVNAQTQGEVRAVVRQPDSKLVIGGEFNELNGVATHNLARLNSDGSPDRAFSANGGTVDAPVVSLALQPDGKIAVAGGFVLAANVVRPILARFLASGALDAGFVPAVSPVFLNEPLSQGAGFHVLCQADGKLILGGTVQSFAGDRNLLRFEGATGQLDPGFQSALANPFIRGLTLQPDGKLLVAGSLTANNQPYGLCRLLPSGALDPAFSPTLLSAVGGTLLQCATVGPTGAIYVGGTFASYGPVATSAVARLQPNGTPDPGFVSGLSARLFQNTATIVIQPNGRLLLGGIFSATNVDAGGMARLFPNGGRDLSFDLTRTPRRSVQAIVVQPDGAIVAGGQLTEVMGLPFNGLARLLATNVLNVAAPQEKAPLDAWPIPAHDVLHVQLDAAARPQEVLLHDAVGRVVLRQVASQNQMVLNTASLAPGVYALSVRYATGTVVRRIAVE